MWKWIRSQGIRPHATSARDAEVRRDAKQRFSIELPPDDTRGCKKCDGLFARFHVPNADFTIKAAGRESLRGPMVGGGQGPILMRRKKRASAPAFWHRIDARSYRPKAKSKSPESVSL